MDERVKIRPSVVTLPSSSDFEKFQNQTLRPVIKLQHDLIIELFHQIITNKKLFLEELSEIKKQILIKTLFENDTQFKTAITFLVVGQLTLDEFVFFMKNRKELSRRICQMCKSKLLRQIGLIN